MFRILILIWIWSLVFGRPMSQILSLYLDFEDAKNIHVLKVLIWDLEDSGGSCLGVGNLILIWILSLVFDTPMIKILALYLNFSDAKNIHVLQVLILGFGGGWMFLSGVKHLDFDLDIVTGL